MPENARVLDLGCAGGHVAALLETGRIAGSSGGLRAAARGVTVSEFLQHDLNAGPARRGERDYQYVLMLDVIEHLANPERFVERLYDAAREAPDVRIMVSTGNVGFIVTRLLLLLGRFNYGKRGILDLTHTRLFTFKTLRRLFEQGGFDVVESRGVPAPFPLAFGGGRFGHALVALNKVFVALCRGLFSYQIFMIVRPRPSLELLLAHSQAQAVLKAHAYRRSLGAEWAPSDGEVPLARPDPVSG